MLDPRELTGWYKRIVLTDNASELLQQAAAEDGEPWSLIAEMPTLYEIIALVSQQVRAVSTSRTWSLGADETEVRAGGLRAADMLDKAAREIAGSYAHLFPITPSETQEPATNIVPLRRAA